jgi:hypothetical protein
MLEIMWLYMEQLLVVCLIMPVRVVAGGNILTAKRISCR